MILFSEYRIEVFLYCENFEKGHESTAQRINKLATLGQLCSNRNAYPLGTKCSLPFANRTN